MKKEHVLHKSLSSDNLSYKSMCNGQLKTWGNEVVVTEAKLDDVKDS